MVQLLLDVITYLQHLTYFLWYSDHGTLVKISPCMSQKRLRFGNDVGAYDFMKFAKKYHKQVGEESASIGRLTVCAASPPLLQMLAEYCRKTM